MFLVLINPTSEDWLSGEINEEENNGDNLHQNDLRFPANPGDPLEQEIQTDSPEIMELEGLDDMLDLGDEAGEFFTEELEELEQDFNLDARGAGKEGKTDDHKRISILSNQNIQPEITSGIKKLNLDLKQT